MSGHTLRPSEIARETLRRLAAERLPPSPENYREYYQKIAGSGIDVDFPGRHLKTIADSLPRNTPERLRAAQQFERAVGSGQWAQLKDAVLQLVVTSEPPRLAWGGVITGLLGHFERRHVELTTAQKRAALEHVIEASNGNAERLHARLQALVHHWDEHPHDKHIITAPTGEPATVAAGVDRRRRQEPTPAAGGSLTELLSVVIKRAIVPALGNDEPMRAEAEALADAVTAAGEDTLQTAALLTRLNSLTARVEWVEDDRRAVRESLIKLLKLILDNIGQLVADDSWLRGQLQVVSEAFADPLDIRVLDEAERRLRDVIDKQSQLKQQLTAAQERLKSMLIGFMDRLAGFSDSTDRYHVTLERCAHEIEGAENLEDLANAVGELLSETRDVRESTQRSGEELKLLRDEVEAANHRISQLQRELDETSELVRHDPLTGVLNRKGIDEAIEREISVMQRRGTPLGVALLDIDNFKQLNDTFGHRTGDDALQHLVSVIQDNLRPEDTVGRFGGEEFIVLLPDTTEDQGLTIVSRLQRALTKRFFLAGNKRLLITFSAGLSQMRPDESPDETIDRADRAMYAAKRAGKNRVHLAA